MLHDKIPALFRPRTAIVLHPSLAIASAAARYHNEPTAKQEKNEQKYKDCGTRTTPTNGRDDLAALTKCHLQWKLPTLATSNLQ